MRDVVAETYLSPVRSVKRRSVKRCPMRSHTVVLVRRGGCPDGAAADGGDCLGEFH